MSIKKALKALFICLFVLGNSVPSQGMGGRETAFPRQIQIAIIKSTTTVGLRVMGEYVLTTLSGKKELYRVPSNKWLSFTAGSTGISVGNNTINYNGIRLKNAGRGKVLVEGKELEGDILIYLKKDKKLLVVNRINIEEYLKEKDRLGDLIKCPAIIQQIAKLSPVQNR